MPRIWHLTAAAIALVMLAPLIVVAGAFLTPTGDVWQHIATYVLPRVTVNTILLTVSVAVLTLVVGAAAAWCTTVYDFPLRSLLAWALLLPLAMPGYVIAFALAGMFGYGGALPTFLREQLGIVLPEFPGGVAAALCLTLTLYPYVYLLARQAFQSQGARAIEVAQSLGMSRARGFRRIALPLARPWLVAGVSLVCMETLADFGTVKVFNFDTFTTAIYGAWFGLFSLQAALQMSTLLLLLVLAALWLERRGRDKRRFDTRTPLNGTRRVPLRGRAAWLASGACLALFLLAFGLPVAQLVVWAVAHLADEAGTRYWQYARASLVLAALAAALLTLMSLLLGFSERRAPGPLTRICARIATLGYALPGTVLAVGFFVVVAGLGHALTAVLRWLSADATLSVTLTGTLLVMLLAYAARFMAVAYGPLASGFERITPRIDDAARGLGVNGVRLLTRVHLPILRPGIAVAALLVFVDVMKELPITLITRPFNWDTLAIRVFQMTIEGEWERAAVAALAIVLAGILPVVLLYRRSAATGPR